MDRDFFQFGEKNRPESNLRTISAFTTPIDSFNPESELLFGLAQGWVIFGENADPDVSPAQFEITAKYDFFGKTVEENNKVDLRPYIGTEWKRDPIVEELERLRKSMERK